MKTSEKIIVFKMIMIVSVSLFIFCASATSQDCQYGAQLSKINHFLDSNTAAQWINHYSAYLDSVQKGTTKFDVTILPDSSESFNSRFIQKILNVSGCIGERVFTGINNNQKMVIIMGGVDSCGRTLYITDDMTGTQTGGEKNIHLFKQKTEGGGGLVEFGQKP